MSGENISFIEYVKKICDQLGMPISRVVSDTMVAVKIPTTGAEDNPREESIFIELSGTDPSGNRLIEVFSSPERFVQGTEESLSPLLLLQNNYPLYAYWAIRKLDGEAYLIAKAITNTDILTPDLMEHLLFSVLRRRIEFRKLLKQISDIAIENINS